MAYMINTLVLFVIVLYNCERLLCTWYLLFCLIFSMQVTPLVWLEVQLVKYSRRNGREVGLHQGECPLQLSHISWGWMVAAARNRGDSTHVCLRPNVSVDWTPPHRLHPPDGECEVASQLSSLLYF
jgi:hypothetical protein